MYHHRKRLARLLPFHVKDIGKKPVLPLTLTIVQRVGWNWMLVQNILMAGQRMIT